MKPFALLLALSVGAAYAQRVDPARIAGDYVGFGWGREIRRTLHLDRDGGVEIVTEVRGADDDRAGDDRRGERDDYARFGWTAREAARGHAVRQTGVWRLNGARVELRLDGVRDHSGFATRGREEAELVPKGDGFVLGHAEDLYGREAVEFRLATADDRSPEPVPDFALPPGSASVPSETAFEGDVRLGDERLRPEVVEFSEAEGKGTLVVRAGERRFDLKGEVEKRDGETLLHVEGDGIDRLFKHEVGTLTITLDRGRVRAVRGAVRLPAGRLDFGDGGTKSGTLDTRV